VTTPAKLYCLESFHILAKKIGQDCVLERLVPYIDFLLHDPMSHRVRAEALNTLVNCLDMVEKVPPSDYNIFSGYIFPSLDKMDRDLAVRVAMASNIAKLARISMR